MTGFARSAAILPAAWIAFTAATPSPLVGQPALLPSAAGEWIRTDSVGVFAGKDLYLLVDGGADLFFEYGFVRALSSEYSLSPEVSVTTELYEMESPTAAYGLFTSFTAGTGIAVSVGQEAVLGEGYCVFWKGSYVGMLTAAAVDSASGQMLLRLAGELERGIRRTGSLPDVCALLREGGVEYRRTVFVRGKLALGNHFSQAWANALPKTDGVVGESGPCRYVILEYADTVAACVALRTAEAEWQRLQMPVARNPGGGWAIPQRDGGVTVLERQGRYLTAVSCAIGEAEALASRLREIFGE